MEQHQESKQSLPPLVQYPSKLGWKSEVMHFKIKQDTQQFNFFIIIRLTDSTHCYLPRKKEVKDLKTQLVIHCLEKMRLSKKSITFM